MVFLRKATDYAFRILLYLSGCQRPRSLEEISENASVPLTETVKVVRRLKNEGFIEKLTDGNVGYVLAKAPEKISMLKIVQVFEGALSLNRCLEADEYCDRDGPKNGCVVRAHLLKIQKMMEEKLEEMTFQKLQSEMGSIDGGENA